MKSVYFVIAAIFLFSCTTGNNVERYQQELLEADKTFSELSLEKGMNEAFETYCAENGVLLRPGSMPIEGKQALIALLAQAADTSFNLTWEPIHAMAAKSGDMGYTYGIYTMSLKVGDMSRKGTYVSIWIRENGQWKWILDTGNEGIGE